MDMGKVRRNWKFWGILLGLMIFAIGFTVQATTVETKAATTGFRTINGKTYYYKDGKRVTGWLTLGGKKYYLNTRTGVLYKGWYKISGGRCRYFDPQTGAMRTGLQKISGKSYYFDGNTGWAKTGFLRAANGNTRYFQPNTYVMASGWMRNSKNQRWYFHPTTGVMYKGLKKVGNYYYYFDGSTGAAKSGFLTAANGNTRYFRGGTYIMATGWITSRDKTQRRYFTSAGVMLKGLRTVAGKVYYFNTSTGVAATGWLQDSQGRKRYFDPDTAVMVTGTRVIDGVEYTFKSDGWLVVPENDDSSDNGTASDNDAAIRPTTPTGTRTIKNYLLGAMQPVGRALYVWGGGWNDSTRKGVSPAWVSWYNSQNSSYDYKNYDDLSVANRAKGLDCSGFVGWAAYQVMHTSSGQGGGYTVVSGDVGSSYQSRGWGTVYNQNYLSKTGYKLYPGDIGFDSGHTWIVLGQCADKSAVIVHSTPQAGCQISGTTTPDGDYDSQAIQLAQQYMSKFSGFSKYDYHTSCGNYIRRGNYLRWNSSTLSDPNGYKNMTANQILADLFS